MLSYNVELDGKTVLVTGAAAVILNKTNDYVTKDTE